MPDKRPRRKTTLIAGIDLGGTNIKSVLMTGSGLVLARNSLPTQADKGRQAVLLNIIRGWNKLVNAAAGAPVTALGLSIPGETDDAGRIWRLPHVAGFERFPVVEHMRKATGLRHVVAENDAACAAVAEHRLGAAGKYQNFLQVTLGTGVGGGLILNSQLFRGRDGFAAEIGHVAVANQGRPCACGSVGCVEAYVGAQGILESYGELGGAKTKRGMPADVAEITKRAEAGERVASETLALTGHLLGHALASILNVLNLEAVVFSGGIRRAMPFMKPSLSETLRARCMGRPVSRLPLLLTKLGDDAGAIGAGLLAAESATR